MMDDWIASTTASSSTIHPILSSCSTLPWPVESVKSEIGVMAHLTRAGAYSEVESYLDMFSEQDIRPLTPPRQRGLSSIPTRTTSLPRLSNPDEEMPHSTSGSRSRKSSGTGGSSSPVWVPSQIPPLPSSSSPAVSDSSTPKDSRLPYRSSPTSVTPTATTGFPRSPLHSSRSQVSLTSASGGTRRPSNPTRPHLLQSRSSSTTMASPVLSSPSEHSHYSSYAHSQKYDVKRMLSKPAPPSSSFGSTTTFLSSQNTDTDDYLDDFLKEGAGSGSPGTSAGNGGRLTKVPAPWTSAMTTIEPNHPFPSSKIPPSSRSSTSLSTGADYVHAGDVNSRRPSKSSIINSQQPSYASGASSTSTHHTLMSSLENYSLSNTTPTPLQQKSSQATLSPFSGEFLESNTITVSPYPESPVPRVMTPASAFIFAYQQSQLRGSSSNSNIRPATSPQSASSVSEHGVVRRSIGGGTATQFLTAPSPSSHQSRSVSPGGTSMSSSGHASPSPFSSLGSKGKLVAIGSVEDSSKRAHKLVKSPPDPNASSSSGIKGLRRKVSGKFGGGRKGSASKTDDDGNAPPLPLEVSVEVSVSSSSSTGQRDDTEEMRFGVDEDDDYGDAASGRGRSRRPEDFEYDYRYGSRGGAITSSPLPSQHASSIDSHGYGGVPTGSGYDKPKMTRTKSRTTLFGIPLGGGGEDSGNTSQPTTPVTPNSAGGKDKEGGMSIWKLVKKFSSSTLKEKHRNSDREQEVVPPVPAIPSNLVGTVGLGAGDGMSRRRSSESIDYGEVAGSRFGYKPFGGVDSSSSGVENLDVSDVDAPIKSGRKSFSSAAGAMIGSRSRSGTISSSQYYAHGGQIAPTPSIPFSKTKSTKSSNKSSSIAPSKRSASQSRGAASSMMSSSPSDIASSRFFFARGQSPRTSTSSYGVETMSAYHMDGSNAGSLENGFVPPVPKPVGQYIMSPDEISAQMAEDSSYVTSSGASTRSGRTGQRSRQPAPPLPSNTYPPPRKSFGGISLSGRSSLYRERSISRPSTPPVPGGQQPASSASSFAHPASSTSSLASTNIANKSVRSKQKVAALGAATMESRSVIAIQGAVDEGGSFEITTSHVRSPSKASMGGASMASKKPGLLRRLGRSKSEVKLFTGGEEPLTNVADTGAGVGIEVHSSSRWSVDEKRGSAGSGSNRSAKRYSATRSASLDSPLRSPGLEDEKFGDGATRVAFRELKEAQKVKRTEDEKAAMWDMLMEKSEKAGGTLRAKIDDSGY